MTRADYEYLQFRLRRKLDDRKPAGMTGKRGEGYEAGIRAAMSVIKEIYTTKKETSNYEYKDRYRKGPFLVLPHL